MQDVISNVDMRIIATVILGVAVVSCILFIIGLLKYNKTKNVRILSVTAAFGVFFLKNLIASIGLYFAIIPHGDLELFDAFFDLVAVILLLLPVIKK